MEIEEIQTYIDSQLFLAAAAFTNEEGNAARQLILKHPALVTSAFTIADVIRVATRLVGKEQTIWMCEKLSSLPNLQILNYDASIVKTALEIFKTSNLNQRQSIHLATMQLNDITRIASLDPEFDKIKGIKRVKL